MADAPAGPAAMGERGVFISFEGGEGAGKSTQIKRLAAHLTALRGDAPVLVREPGGTSGAEAVRAILLQGGAHDWPPMSQALLLYAARVDLWTKTIAPALAAGRWVLADRFADSTAAYQGAAGALGRARVAALHEVATPEARPDLTLFLDMPVARGLARARGRSPGGDAFEDRDLEFHQDVLDGFRAIAAQEPERVITIDADQCEDAVADAVWAAVAQRLSLHAGATHER